MSFQRYVALGDSFTEGVGDPDPSRPNGLRGWADRVAEALAADAARQGADFGYANLAIRGRKLRRILGEQLEPALALQPDLVTVHAGANDVLRPKVDLDDLAAAYDAGVGRLAGSGARVVMFTIWDPGSAGLYAALRGRMAIFNEWVREIADRHGVTIVDMWRMRDVGPVQEWMDGDRMHLNAVGHQHMAIAVLDALGLEHPLVQLERTPIVRGRREQLAENARWTREFLVPWMHRRLTGRSSGDGITPKRPELERVDPLEDPQARAGLD